MAGTLDDISVAESPATVAAPFLDQITSHSIRINWAASTDSAFSHYAIFRSTTAAVGINSTLVATITNQGTTSFTDTNLPLDTLYYYRVYAVGPYGTFSPDSPEANSARTLNNPLPFADDFEGGLINWNLTGSWGLDNQRSPRADSFASPILLRAPTLNSSDTYALTAVNLSGSSLAGAALQGPPPDGRSATGAGWRFPPTAAAWTRIYGVDRRAHRVGRAEH